MSEQISISTSKQGTNTAATKAHTSGKGPSFLGMLMAAIGHKATIHLSGKPSEHKSSNNKDKSIVSLADMTNNSEVKQASKNAKTKVGFLAPTDANNQGSSSTRPSVNSNKLEQETIGNTIENTGIGQHQFTRIDGTSNTTAGAAGAHQNASTMVVSTEHKTQVNTTSNTTAGATKAIHSSSRLFDTIVDDSEHDTKISKSNSTHKKVEQAVRHHNSKINQHQTVEQSTDVSASIVATAATTAPQTDITTPDRAQGKVKSSDSSEETLVFAKDHSSGVMDKVHNPEHSVDSISKEAMSLGKSKTLQPNLPVDADATAKTSGHVETKPVKVETVPAESAQGISMSKQPSVDTLALGMHTESSRNGKESVPEPHKSSLHINSAVTASSKQTTVTGHGNKEIMALQTNTHPQDISSENAHLGSSYSLNDKTPNPSKSQTGINSYNKLDGAKAQLQANLVSQADQPDNRHSNGPSGASLRGQDGTTAGNMNFLTSPGTNQIQQTMANTHSTIPQPPVHSSGPWTAMAAMQEIGQAAMNGKSRLELQLEPAHLGKVHVRIDSDSRKNIQVHLVVEQPESRQFIEQQLPNLRHVLEQQGLSLGNFSMSNQQQGNGHGPGYHEQQTPTVSIQSVSGLQISAPKATNTMNEPSSSGRLSIRI